MPKSENLNENLMRRLLINDRERHIIISKQFPCVNKHKSFALENSKRFIKKIKEKQRF